VCDVTNSSSERDERPAIAFGRPLRLPQRAHVPFTLEISSPLRHRPPLPVAARRPHRHRRLPAVIRRASFPVSLGDRHPDRVAEKTPTAPSAPSAGARPPRASRSRSRPGQGREAPDEVRPHVQEHRIGLGAQI
jgi:hypothetical protein